MNFYRTRYQEGSVEIQKRKHGEDVWVYRYSERGPDGKSHRRGKQLGTVKELTTKTAAEKKAGYLRIQANESNSIQHSKKLFSEAIDKYVSEEMSEHTSTRRSEISRLENHIRPKWGDMIIEDVKPIHVRTWIRSLPLSDKSRSHIHGLMRQLFNKAMLWEWIELTENPMSLFRSQSQNRKKQKTILTIDQFQQVLALIPKEPFKTMVLVAMCVGPRRSEFIALKWSDFDWQKKTLFIRRAIVDGVLGQVKTKYSDVPMPLDDDFAAVLQAWRGKTEFSAESDWVFASPFVAGEMPYWPNGVNARYLRKAGEQLGLGRIGWHTLRHTYRSWLDVVGTPIGVMKDLMRHSDIRTTMNVYGGGLPESMREANQKVVRMALRA